MEKRYNILEASVGAIVILISVFFVIFFYSKNGFSVKGYEISALFERIDGLNVGSDIRVNGIKIGKISDISIDPKNYQAKVVMTLDDSFKLPEDTSAEVSSTGLMGEKYVALVPGVSNENLKNGDTITDTQPSISFEKLIGKFMFSSEDKK